MAQLEGNSGKNDVSASGSKEPVTDGSSTFAANEVKATPSISDTSLFETTLLQEETAAASKFAESVWKPVKPIEKDKDKDEAPSQQSIGAAPAIETARSFAKNQVEVIKSTGALFRSARGAEEQFVEHKLIATNNGDKRVDAVVGKIPIDGGKKDLGPVTTLGAVADSITKDATAGSSVSFKPNTNELKPNSVGAAQSSESSQTQRNEVTSLIKTDSFTNPALNQKIEAGAVKEAKRSYSLDAAPPVRIDASPVIKTMQAFQPADKIVTAGGGVFEVHDGQGKPAVEVRKPNIIEDNARVFTTEQNDIKIKTQAAISGDVTISGQKSFVPNSYDMPPRLQIDKPAIVQTITSKQDHGAAREAINSSGYAPSVSVGKISEIATSKGDNLINRVEPIFTRRGSEAIAPAIVNSDNSVKGPVNELKSSGFGSIAQTGTDAFAKRAEPIIVKSGVSEPSALKDYLKGGAAQVGSINSIKVQGFEAGKPYNPHQGEITKIYDGSKVAAALGVGQKNGIEADFARKFINESSMPTTKSLANSLQEPPRGFIDSGSGKPAIIYPKPIDGGAVNFKDPQVGFKPESIKPFTTAKIVDGSQLVPAGPGKFDKVIAGNEFKQPADGINGIIGKPSSPIGQIDAGSLKPLPNLELGKNPGGQQGNLLAELGDKVRPNQPGTSGGELSAKPPFSDALGKTPPSSVQAESVSRQQPGITDIAAKPAMPADGAFSKPSSPADSSKPGVVVSPIDGSIKPVNPVNPVNPANPATGPEIMKPGAGAQTTPRPATELPRTTTPPAEVKPSPVAPKLEAPALRSPVTAGDTTKGPAARADSTAVPSTASDMVRTPVLPKDGAKLQFTPADTGSPRPALKSVDAALVSDAGVKPSGRIVSATDPVTAFEQSTQRVRQLTDGRFDAGMRNGPLESVLNGRVTQIRDLGADSAGRLDGGRNVQSARLDFDVRAEVARNLGTNRSIVSDGGPGRRGGETALTVREQQLTSFEPQAKNVSAAKFETVGNRVSDIREPQGRIEIANPAAGIGRIPLSGSVKVADFQPGTIGQVDGRVVGDVGKLPGVRGFGQIGDARSFVSHGEIRAPRGESHRYITGLELALILSIAGIAKIRHDARSGAARMDGRTWSITRQNGRPLIYIDGRQNPFQPQRAFGKGDGSFRIMVAASGEQAAKLSTRSMRTTDIVQTKTTDAASQNTLNLGLLGKYHYLNYFGKNMPSMNYYGQFRSSSYTGSMGLAFVMAATGMTRPGAETVQGMEKLNPIAMGPADRIRMQNQSLLTPFGKFNLDAVLASSANGRDIREKEDRDEKRQDNSLSVLDDYQNFLSRLDGFSKKKEETEDEAVVINRRLSFGVEDLYDESSEEEKIENLIEEDDTTGNALSKVLRRPKWVIQQGETLDGLAERFFANADLGWLIADLNRALVRETYIDNKRIIELQSRLEIELPVWQDIQKFNQNRKKNWTAENLVTIIVERQIDREVLESTLARVVGAEA
jgi:hypothetical protein